MAGVYRPRHPERTVLYRVLFHYFDRFISEYESRFQRDYGFLRPIIKEVVERYLDCGNPKCGFAGEVLASLVHKELLRPEWAERILFWRHTGFSVHSRVRAKTKPEAERVGKYMIRPLLSLERLSFLEKEGKVCYRYGEEAKDEERMDYLEFVARVTSHIPDKGQVTVRYYGLYANAHRGKVKKASLAALPLRVVDDQLRPIPAKGWAQMIRKVY